MQGDLSKPPHCNYLSVLDSKSRCFDCHDPKAIIHCVSGHTVGSNQEMGYIFDKRNSMMDDDVIDI